jgi:hypothetical protein
VELRGLIDFGVLAFTAYDIPNSAHAIGQERWVSLKEMGFG